MILYSYTCHHGHDAIGQSGHLLTAEALTPALEDWPPAGYIWATDLARPNPAALGLTRNLARCDRTRYRYRILDPTQFTHWPRLRRTLDWEPSLLEAAPGARPMHWYCSTRPAPVVYDPPGGNP